MSKYIQNADQHPVLLGLDDFLQCLLQPTLILEKQSSMVNFLIWYVDNYTANHVMIALIGHFTAGTLGIFILSVLSNLPTLKNLKYEVETFESSDYTGDPDRLI